MRKRKVTDLGENEVIHCKTSEEAVQITKLMNENGLKWCNGDKYEPGEKRESEGDKLCYSPFHGTYYGIDYLIAVGLYKVYPASDFIEEELKEGDWCYISDKSEEDALRNKEKRIFLYKYPGGRKRPFITINEDNERDFMDGDDYFTCERKYAIPIPKETKKRRKTRPLTDSEREKAKKNNYGLDI